MTIANVYIVLKRNSIGVVEQNFRTKLSTTKKPFDKKLKFETTTISLEVRSYLCKSLLDEIIVLFIVHFFTVNNFNYHIQQQQ